MLIVLNTLQHRHIECGDGGGSPVAASDRDSKLSGAGTSAQNAISIITRSVANQTAECVRAAAAPKPRCAYVNLMSSKPIYRSISGSLHGQYRNVTNKLAGQGVVVTEWWCSTLSKWFSVGIASTDGQTTVKQWLPTADCDGR